LLTFDRVGISFQVFPLGFGMNHIKQGLRKIEEADAAFTYKTVGTPKAGWFSAKPLFDVIHAENLIPSIPPWFRHESHQTGASH
jgi:hypothetical protein